MTANKGMAANAWHTDVTFVDRVPAFSILRAVTIPPYGGNTVWANTVAAYDELPAPLKALVDGLWAVHTNNYDYAQRDEEREQPDANFTRDEFASQSSRPSTRWCACTRRPASGRCCSATSSSASTASTPRSRPRSSSCCRTAITKLENTIRWTWQEGDVAIWDNRATQHYAVADFGNETRRSAGSPSPATSRSASTAPQRGPHRRRRGVLAPGRADQLSRPSPIACRRTASLSAASTKGTSWSHRSVTCSTRPSPGSRRTSRM